MISIIIPFYNEEETLEILYKKSIDALKKYEYEVIFVDDGSTDNSKLKVQSLKSHNENNEKFPARRDPALREKSKNPEEIVLITHRKRLGKGKALLSGFNASKGDIIVFIDADLQNDPADIPRLLAKIYDGYDLVNGWRRNRKDEIGKTLPSSVFNWLIIKPFLGSQFHDINCGLKALRRVILEEIPLYGDNYRFLPQLANNAGFRTTEIVVGHTPRLHGVSKYGFFRLFFGLIDTITTYFVYRFSEKPLHFFGSIGGSFFSIGFLLSIYMTVERIFYGKLLYRRPLLLFAALLIIVGIQIIMTGIIGELIVYISQKSRVKSRIGI